MPSKLLLYDMGSVINYEILNSVCENSVKQLFISFHGNQFLSYGHLNLTIHQILFPLNLNCLQFFPILRSAACMRYYNSTTNNIGNSKYFIHLFGSNTQFI